ncbi:MAG: glycosyltransferase, partial [Chloroflexi bacterium]|nr:glycosyltransferase [Chloroflexota bacterium]
MGGSKESLYQILRSLPDEFARQVVLERGSDPGFNERARRYASAVHLLPLPTWQQYRRRTLAERARAPLADAWRLLRCALAAFKIARVIRQERIDLVHTNNSMSPSGALAARLTATPHIWHVRESIGKHKQYPLLLGNLALRLMRRWSDTVICNSDYTAEVFREMRIPVRVIPNGLDLADFAPDAGTPRELGSLADLPPGEKRVGMVGNLTIGKEKYEDVEKDIEILLKKSEALIMRLNQLVQKDAAVFEPLARAYRMPTITAQERAEKDKVMQESLIQATKVPLAVAECSLEGIRLLDQYARKGSRLAVSDAGVGVLLCKSAIQGSKLNVLT